jgi:rod shape-determining protein MreD
MTPPSVAAVRAATILVALASAVVLQVSVFPLVAWRGVTPNLCLLVVVAVALANGPIPAMAAGFGGGLILDLAPPADHSAGRWALALVVVGYAVALVGPTTPVDRRTAMLTVAGSSFVATSIFAFSGLLLGEVGVGVPGILEVVGLAVVWDVALAAVVVPPLVGFFTARAPSAPVEVAG